MHRYPVALFLVLTFALAWLLWGYWVVAMPPGGLVMTPAFLAMAIAGGLAPSLAAVVTLRITAGAPAAWALVARLRDWPSASMAAFSLLLGPCLAALGWLIQGAVYPQLVWPDIAALVPVLLLWPLMAALGEELGWRGLLFPRLAERTGLIRAALIVGLIWGLWHLPPDYIALKATGEWFWLAFLVNGPFVLTGHSLVMAWLWKRTGGNLVSMILYHLGITASAMPSPSPGPDALAQIGAAAVGAAVIWLAAALLWGLDPGRRRSPGDVAA